jgi:sigma-B regulation protein RsbU (phosphoserine phosphatase)
MLDLTVAAGATLPAAPFMPSEIRNPSHSGTSTSLPVLVFVQGSEQQSLVLHHTPFGIGRKADKDLVIADPRVSRDHAQIVLEDGKLFLVDQGSKHGTFINGERIDRQLIEPNDRLEFGARDSGYVIFNPNRGRSNTAREFLSQVSGIRMGTDATELETLRLFLQAARKLNTSGVLDEILVTMLEVTLRLTRAERGFVFLRKPDGSLQLAAGRTALGELLLDDRTISHSLLDEALRSNSEFLLTDTSSETELGARESIVANELRTVVCIPLRKTLVQRAQEQKGSAPPSEALGVLYVDSRLASRGISGVGQDILHAIATEAASLIENARLVQAEESARRYQQELSIAAFIQQRLMEVKIPEVPFARMRGRNLSCREVGGDFYDALMTKDGLAIILADVSGKGVSAALLASTLQGMVYSHLSAGSSLASVATSVNRFIAEKLVGEKYATLLIARLKRDGELEYANCGHVPPLLVCGDEVMRPPNGNLPVGLLADATYETATCQMRPGDRFFIVTDGVTEAENASGDMFEDSRLEQAVLKHGTMEGIFAAVTEFCGDTPLNDDCTVVELTYTGE